MMLTESEARTKWCPHARVLSPKGSGSNRCEGWDQPKNAFHDRAYIHAGSRCQASDCMAWRWGSGERGYCGLAGVPGKGEGAMSHYSASNDAAK